MSTLKPRITVTLEPRSYEVISRLSAASGDSMSKIVASFVDLAVPSLERVVLLLERAKTAPEEVRAGLTAAMERADRDLIPLLMDGISQADMFLADAQGRLPTYPLPAAKVQAYADTNGVPPAPAKSGAGGHPLAGGPGAAVSTKKRVSKARRPSSTPAQ